MIRGGDRQTSMAQVMDASTNAPMNIPRAPCTSTCEKCACKQLIESGYEDVISWLPSASQKTLNVHTDTHTNAYTNTHRQTHKRIHTETHKRIHKHTHTHAPTHARTHAPARTNLPVPLEK